MENEVKTVEIDGAEVAIDDLVAAYKAMGPDEESRLVRDAWYEKFQPSDDGMIGSGDAWVSEVLDGKVLVKDNSDCYLYPYGIDAEGAVSFGEPQKVRIEYVPVEDNKSIDIDRFAIKVLREQDGGVVVGGPMCWYADAEHKDLQGDYFTPETETWHDIYKSAPALFNHGLDGTLGLAVIGHRVKAEQRPDCLWVEDWLNTSSEYWRLVKPLLDAKALYYSPGSAPHLVKRENDGRLLSYPVVEDTLTVTPAQHRMRSVEQIKAAYKAAGIELPELPEPEHEPQDDGEGAGGPARLDVERARAKAEATLSYIKTLEEVTE